MLKRLLEKAINVPLGMRGPHEGRNGTVVSRIRVTITKSARTGSVVRIYAPSTVADALTNSSRGIHPKRLLDEAI